MKKVFISFILFLIILSPLKVNALADNVNQNRKTEIINVFNKGKLSDNNVSILAKDSGDLGNLMPSKGSQKCDKAISKLVIKYWKWVVFLIPILLIVMITIDFIKALASGDADSIKKSSSSAITRVIAAVILIALPWAIKVVFTWLGINQYLCF